MNLKKLDKLSNLYVLFITLLLFSMLEYFMFSKPCVIRILTLIFVFLSLSLFLFNCSVSAVSPQLQIIKDKQDAIKEGSNQETWLDEALGSNVISGIRALGGDIPDSILNGEYDPNGPIIYAPNGALGGVNKLVVSLYNPPASGIEYIAMMKDNFLGKPAYAQGIGFTHLSPLLPIWRTFRNVIYLLSSLIFVAIGLMIIFRIKINPQTVISIQNAIPRIIIALVLVTFSYAIAGLLIDFVYVIQAFFVALLFKAGSSGEIGLTNNLFSPDLFGTIREYFSSLLNIPQSEQLYNFYNLSNPGLIKFFELTKAILPTYMLTILGSTLGAAIGGIIGALTLNPVAVLVGGGSGLVIGGALIILILQIIILISLFRFFIGLAKAYISVLLKIIIAPLEIGIGALPNSKINFSTWIYDLVANLAIFPVSIIFIIIVNLIIRNSSTIGGIWAPSPIAIVGAINIIPAIIGFASILLLPKLPDLIHQVVFQLKPSPWGTAIGETYKTTIGQPLGAAGTFALQYGSDRQKPEYERITQGGRTPSRIRSAENAFYDVLGIFKKIKRS
jgi:hypothetical protein